MPAERSYADQTFYGDVQFVGDLTVPAGSFDNNDVAASAGIDASKLEHRLHPAYGQPNTAAADETRVFYVAMAAGTVLDVDCGNIVKAIGDATCTVDVKKNGTTILSAVVTLNSSSANYTPQAATLSGTPTYVAGDVFTVVIDATIGTGTLPTGVYVGMRTEEAAA